MRLRMTATEFRGFADGFGLAIWILGLGLGGVPLIWAVMTLVDVDVGRPPLGAFHGLVLQALGLGLRLAVRIDKRLENNGLGLPEESKS